MDSEVNWVCPLRWRWMGAGYPHISYWKKGDLAYAYLDASGWHIQVWTVEQAWAGGLSLALDGAGYPHISYYDQTHDDLIYTHRDASGWHIHTVDSFGGTLVSLA